MEFQTKDILIKSDMELNEQEQILVHAMANLLNAILLGGQATLACILLKDVAVKLSKDHQKNALRNRI